MKDSSYIVLPLLRGNYLLYILEIRLYLFLYLINLTYNFANAADVLEFLSNPAKKAVIERAFGKYEALIVRNIKEAICMFISFNSN